MRNKIKTMSNFLKRAGVGVSLLPFAVMAQVENPEGTELPSSTIYEIISNMMMWLLGILGFVAVIGFVISGIMYLVAAGDEDAQKKAKRAMYYSITGVIVGLVGLIVFSAVQSMLGSDTKF